MKLVYLSAGTGNYYSGSALHDHYTCIALRRVGHDVKFVPLFLPILVEEDEYWETPLFYWLLNTLQQQQSFLFRHTPEWLDKMWDRPALLEKATTKSEELHPDQRAELYLSLLAGRHGRQAKELRKLCTWLQDEKPDLAWLKRLKIWFSAPYVFSFRVSTGNYRTFQMWISVKSGT